MKTDLVKYTVCAECKSVGLSDINCICCHSDSYGIIELEFEVCLCCSNLITDQPADTEFNKKQIKL